MGFVAEYSDGIHSKLNERNKLIFTFKVCMETSYVILGEPSDPQHFFDSVILDIVRIFYATKLKKIKKNGGFDAPSACVKIGLCCFSAKPAALRSKSKDWSAKSQNNVSG